MATSSLDEEFIITDNEVAQQFRELLDNAPGIAVPEKDIKGDEEKAIELLKRTLPAWGLPLPI